MSAVLDRADLEQLYERAACGDLNAAEADAMFYGRGKQAAIRTCLLCPVRLLCRAYADDLEGNSVAPWRVEGIYAGETPDARIARRRDAQERAE